MSDRDRKPPFRRGGGKPFEKGRKPAGRPVWRDRDGGADGPVILYGWHTVAAALANPQRKIRKLFLTENAARRLADENIDTQVTPEIVRPNTIDQRLGPDAVHQGLLAEAEPLPSPGRAPGLAGSRFRPRRAGYSLRLAHGVGGTRRSQPAHPQAAAH